MTAITRQAIVRCHANGNMEHDFIGTIKKCYENSALVMIDQFDPADRMNARDLLYQAVISKRQMEVLTPGISEQQQLEEDEAAS